MKKLPEPILMILPILVLLAVLGMEIKSHRNDVTRLEDEIRLSEEFVQIGIRIMKLQREVIDDQAETIKNFHILVQKNRR